MTAIITTPDSAMTKIDEKAVWPSEIYQIRRGDKVSGGKDGVANIQAGQLADRTAYLKKSLESFSVMIQSGDAPYTDESAAQAAINAGKIAEGALFSVRSTDPMIWVAEYKNQGGTPVATGKVIADSRAIAISVFPSEADPDGTAQGIAATLPAQLFRVIFIDDEKEVIYRNESGSAAYLYEVAGAKVFNEIRLAMADDFQAVTSRQGMSRATDMPARRTIAADFTQYLDTWSAGGLSRLNSSATFASRVLLSLTTFSTNFATGPCRLRITGAGRVLFDKGFLSGESLRDGLLTTPYFDVSMRAATLTKVTGNNTKKTWVLEGAIKLPKPFSPAEGRVLYDREGRIPVGIASAAYTYTDDTLTFDAAAGLLRVAVAQDKMTAAGFENTESGAQAYFWKTYGDLILSQKSTETQILPEYTLFFSEAGEVSVITDQNCTATVQVTKKLALDNGAMLARAASTDLRVQTDRYAVDKFREINAALQDHKYHLGAVGNYGSAVAYSATFSGDSIFVLDKLSLAANVRRAVMSLTDSAGAASVFTLLESESVTGRVLSSPYVDFVLQPVGIYALSINTDTGRTTFKIPVTLPGALPADPTRIIRDRTDYFGAYTPSTLFSGSTRGITYEASTGSLIVALMNTDITTAGYPLTSAGVIQYAVEKLSGYVFSQLTANAVTRPFSNLFRASAGAVSLTTDAAVTLTGNFYGAKMSSDNSSTYQRYESTVKNNSGTATGLRPVKLKYKFKAGEVPNDKCIVVTDTTGKVYPCQWAGERDFNPRRGRTLSYWGDDSLRSGELLIMDSLAAGEVKKYIIKAFPTEQFASSVNHTVQETNSSFLVTADDGTQVRFDSVVGWLPYKLTRDAMTYTAICQQLLIRLSGGAWSIFATTYQDAKYTIISDGPVFTEIETTFTNGVAGDNQEIAAGLLKFTYRTKIFRNGYIQIDAAVRLATDMPANVLFGCMTRIQMNSTAVKTIRNEYNAIWTDNAMPRSVSIRVAGGDVIRDEAEAATLGNRPPVAGLTANASYVRFDGGWQAGATYGAAKTTLGAPKNWTWTVGFSINLNEPVTDNVSLSDVEMNPVVGFASQSSVYPRVRQAALMSRLGNVISGLASWNKRDASATDNANGAFNTVAGDIVQLLHLRTGTFAGVYAKFQAWALAQYGGAGIASIHLGAPEAYQSLQFASRLVLPQLWWLYQLAVMEGDAAKQTELKTAIDRMASDCYAAFGGVGKANSNFYAAAFRAWAMAVATGTDPAGNYTAAMDMVDGQFSSPTYFAGVKNIITDNVVENVPKRMYLHYQMYAWNNYLVGCRIAGRRPVLDMTAFALNAISGYGGLREIDYCAAESRRGVPSTVAFMLYPLLHAGDNSCLEAAERMMDAFDEYAGANTNGQIKLWDLDYYSVVSTNFSDYTFACNIMADAWLQWWAEGNN